MGVIVRQAMPLAQRTSADCRALGLLPLFTGQGQEWVPGILRHRAHQRRRAPRSPNACPLDRSTSWCNAHVELDQKAIEGTHGVGPGHWEGAVGT